MKQGIRSQHMVWGVDCWHIVQMRYCLFISLYQALLIDREMENREKTYIDLMCVEAGVSYFHSTI